MKNYFKTQRVNWNTWSPESIIFKSNPLVKKLLPTENVLSWTTKRDRDQRMSKLTGGKAHQVYQGHSYYTNENYKGVMVELKYVKSDYPSANIDFIDLTHRRNSVGEKVGGLNILMYLNAFHTCWDYVQCPQTKQFMKKTRTNHVPLEEGYRFCYGGQGDANSMHFEEFQELLQITQAIKNFLVEIVVPMKNGELCVDECELMVA